MYNATAESNTYGTLLYVGQVGGSGDGSGDHKVEVRNMDDGKLLALDYFVSTFSGSGGGGNWTAGGSGGSNTVVNTASVRLEPSASASPTSPSSVFPGGNEEKAEGGGTSNSAIIGGIIGALFGLVSTCYLNYPFVGVY